MPCKCTLFDREGDVMVERTGVVKFYVTQDQPGLPGWLRGVDDKIRWIDSRVGYHLCHCPDCAAAAQSHRHPKQAA